MTRDKWVPKVGDEVLFRCRVKRKVADGLYEVADSESKNRSAVATLDELRPADEPSVDEMVEALDWCWDRIEPCESRSHPWARWCVVTQRSEKEHHVYHYGPTPTAAIRAAYDAVVKETH